MKIKNENKKKIWNKKRLHGESQFYKEEKKDTREMTISRSS